MSIQKTGFAPQLQKPTVRRLGENRGPTLARTGAEAPRGPTPHPFARDTFELKQKGHSKTVDEVKFPKSLLPHKELLESMADKLANDRSLDTKSKLETAALELLKESGLPLNRKTLHTMMRLVKARRNDDVFIAGGE